MTHPRWGWSVTEWCGGRLSHPTKEVLGGWRRAEEEERALDRESGVGGAGLRRASVPPHSTTLTRGLSAVHAGLAVSVAKNGRTPPQDPGVFELAMWLRPARRRAGCRHTHPTAPEPHSESADHSVLWRGGVVGRSGYGQDCPCHCVSRTTHGMCGPLRHGAWDARATGRIARATAGITCGR